MQSPTNKMVLILRPLRQVCFSHTVWVCTGAVLLCLGHVDEAQVLFLIVGWYVGAVLVPSQSETIEPKTL